MIKQLCQDLLMIPMHAAEGAAVRWRFAAPLYRLLSAVYHLTRPYLYFGEKEFLRDVRPGGRLLDLGCGSGFILQLLADRFASAVGLDYEAEMIKVAARLVPRALYVRGDMARLPFPQASFDAVVSLGAIHCVDFNLLAAEVSRVLAPRGEVYLLTETGVIPRFVPSVSGDKLLAALRDQGLTIQTTSKVGLLYLYVKARKDV